MIRSGYSLIVTIFGSIGSIQWYHRWGRKVRASLYIRPGEYLRELNSGVIKSVLALTIQNTPGTDSTLHWHAKFLSKSSHQHWKASTRHPELLTASERLHCLSFQFRQSQSEGWLLSPRHNRTAPDDFRYTDDTPLTY